MVSFGPNRIEGVEYFFDASNDEHRTECLKEVCCFDDASNERKRLLLRRVRR